MPVDTTVDVSSLLGSSVLDLTLAMIPALVLLLLCLTRECGWRYTCNAMNLPVWLSWWCGTDADMVVSSWMTKMSGKLA